MYSRPMTADAAHRRLGRVVEQRIAELGLEYTAVARVASISVETLSKIRKGLPAANVTYRRLERALNWQAGSIDAVLAGRHPILEAGASAPDAEVGSPAEVDPRAQAVLTILEGLPTRVQAEVLRQLGDRLPPSVRPDGDGAANGDKREAG